MPVKVYYFDEFQKQSTSKATLIFCNTNCRFVLSFISSHSSVLSNTLTNRLRIVVFVYCCNSTLSARLLPITTYSLIKLALVQVPVVYLLLVFIIAVLIYISTMIIIIVFILLLPTHLQKNAKF